MPASSARDTLAAFRALLARPEVTIGGVSGHSMGGIGAILAAAADPRVGVLVASSSPADPYRLTRQTFRLARLPIPDPIAYPLAWLTTRVYVRPRGHVVRDVNATAAIARYRGPVLLAHGAEDIVVPPAHMERLARRRPGRRAARGDPPVETALVAGGQHSWLYELADYRRAVARVAAAALGGPMAPDAAGEIAAATPAERIPDGEARFAATEDIEGGARTLAQVVLPGATRRVARDDGAVDAGRRPTRPPPRPEPRGVTTEEPVWDAIRSRRAIRRFADRPLEPAHLERILNAGRRAGQLEEPPALGLHRVPRPRAPARTLGRRARGPATSPGPPSGSPW